MELRNSISARTVELLADLEELRDNCTGKYSDKEEIVQGAILDIDSIIDNVLRETQDVLIEV